MLALGVVIGGLFAVLGYFSRRHWTAALAFVLVTTPWLLLMTLGGTMIWWAWLATDHEVARSNENVMQVSVLALPLLVMFPAIASGKESGLKPTLWLTWAIAGISCVGLFPQGASLAVLPGQLSDYRTLSSRAPGACLHSLDPVAGVGTTEGSGAAQAANIEAISRRLRPGARQQRGETAWRFG